MPSARSAARRPLIVTWCTSRKRLHGGVANELVTGSTADRAAAWLEVLRAAVPAMLAQDLYSGRAFRIARDAAERYGTDLSVVSAGLGWVLRETSIPPYSVTVADGGLGSGVDLKAWWTAVLRGPYSSDPATNLRDRSLVLVCIARAYAPFFEAALKSVPRERVRIFGSGLRGALPADLLNAILPYDDRLNAINPGTRSDFAQRALQHFLFNIGPSENIDTDKDRVRAALVGVSKPNVRTGRSLSDTEIRELIRATISTSPLRRTAMLRHFRDVLGVACEQARFARLYAESTAT